LAFDPCWLAILLVLRASDQEFLIGPFLRGAFLQIGLNRTDANVLKAY
jgi:hypothetical protein